MNIIHLQYLCEIEKCGSISKAASQLYLDQSRLSKVLKEVESEMHFAIFERQAKGVVPTIKGEQFLLQAKKVISEFSTLESMNAGNKDDHQLNISIPRASYIADAFVKYLQIHYVEEIDINYHETNPIVAINNVYNGESDLGIIRCPSDDIDYYLNLTTNRDIKAQILHEFFFKVIMSKNNPLANQDIYLDNLLQQTELQHGDITLKDAPLASINEINKKNKRHIRVYERASQFDILEAIPTSYMWVSPMPQSYLDKFNLVEKECIDYHQHVVDLLIYRKGYHISKEDEDFMNILREEIRVL